MLKTLWYALKGLFYRPHRCLKISIFAAVAFIFFVTTQIVAGRIESAIMSALVKWLWLPLALLFLIARHGEAVKRGALRQLFLNKNFVSNIDGKPPEYIRTFLLNSYITVCRFKSFIHTDEWEKKMRNDLAVFYGKTIHKFQNPTDKRQYKDMSIVDVLVVVQELPNLMWWDSSLLLADEGSFELVLGESITGRVTVNMARMPHLLLGGSSGSGKSMLLKLLLMQCILKGEDVTIADFKGGVDFSAIWHDKCHMCFDENDLLELLTDMVNELERRKVVFREIGSANISEYNKATGTEIQRIIFACDEVAELLDKTGLDKESKLLVTQIEGRLSTIARQGRAFGIHLIIATQRPDATILAGQIRNNIDFRVCGRADKVLSQIILDSTAAADEIPKDAQGRFITHDGTVFQSYLFDEKTMS